MTTFADLGVPVPLFLGEHRHAEGVTDGHRCVLCARAGVCLPLDDVVVACGSCGGQTRIRTKGRAANRRDTCHRCDAPVTLHAALTPPAAESLTLGVPLALRGCVSCLRAGRWAQTHVTEAGAIRWEDDAGAELTRTPRYATFQGERWLCCHDLPMCYLGEWTRRDFDAARPGAGDALFDEIVRDIDPASAADAWEHGLTPHGGEPDLRVYVFRCQRCTTLRAHSDCG
ncbi:CbrC family protein [Dactylosporangium sp. NPDC049525]|uniref:CbrC family protein n=1 Tax=Dactylosporangium sp. NPDC049525 TaxID=3154730 RepID=UPI003415AA63